MRVVFRLVALLAAVLTLCDPSRVVDGARILRADVAAVYSVWDPNNICNEPIQTKDCTLDVTCSTCLTRPGCAIESTTGKCVSVYRIDPKVDVEYFLAGQNQYCAASDDACSSCRADDSDSDLVCRGKNGCVCLRECERSTAHAPSCDSSSGSFTIYYVLIAVSILAPALILKRMYKGLTANLPNSAVRRERAQAARDANPLTLKLDGWRGFIEKEHRAPADKIELTHCPTRACSDLAASPDTTMGDDSRWHHSAASTEDGDNNDGECGQDDIQYELVATPRSGGAARG